MTKTKEEKRDSIIAFCCLGGLYVLLLVLELILPPTHMLFSILKKSAVYALAAVSMNLLNGFTGLFSLGQAGFMLMGAYAYAILTMPVALKEGTSVYKYYECAVHFDTGMVVGLIAAGLVAALFAALIGIPVLRLKSDYLGIATLGFAEIIRALFQWDTLGPLTNGANMLSGFIDLNHVYLPFTQIKIPPTFFVFVLSGVCIAIIVLLINSSYGRAFKAIRDDEIAAEAMGINLFRHKELSFVISSFFAGVSGALLAMYQFTVKAAPFKSSMTYEILLIVVIGGIGSITGSCIGSFLFIACNEWWLRFLDDSANNILGLNILRSGFRKVVFSVVIMIIVLFFSKGLMGDREFSVARIRKRIRKLFKKENKAEEGEKA